MSSASALNLDQSKNVHGKDLNLSFYDCVTLKCVKDVCLFCATIRFTVSSLIPDGKSL